MTSSRLIWHSLFSPSLWIQCKSSHNVLSDLTLCVHRIVGVMKNKTLLSIKALEGYLTFQRWMIHFVNEYPELLKKANKIVSDFINYEENRYCSFCNKMFTCLYLTHFTGWRRIRQLSESSYHSWRSLLTLLGKMSPRLTSMSASLEITVGSSRSGLVRFNWCAKIRSSNLST